MANTTITGIRNLARVSQLFQPITVAPKYAPDKSELTSKSYKHLTNSGIIRPVGAGMHALLPLGLRVIDKLTRLVDTEMINIGAQKVLLPALTKTDLWEKTNRFQANKAELFTLQDRHDKSYILSPTHEEAMCDLISNVGSLSTKALPLKLYQISSKWRDEMKPRLGFARSREFIMKDLYTFDRSLENAETTYDLANEAYNRILKQIGIDYVRVIGETNLMGGLLSHEYHYLSDIGEDYILTCPSCKYSVNKNIYDRSNCPNCNNVLLEHQATEIGHAFLLGTIYSKPLNASYTENTKNKPLVMACFGLGLSRLITAAVDILSTNEELRWPNGLAPYTVCIIPPKKGSREEPALKYVKSICEILHRLNIDVILDDRVEWTIGKRFIHTRMTGYPYSIVIGKSAMQSEPLFEVQDIYHSSQHDLSLDGIQDYFNNLGRNGEEAQVCLRMT